MNIKSTKAAILVNQNEYAVIRNQEDIKTLIDRDKLPNWKN